MKTSEQIDQIATALASVQARLKPAHKGKVNPHFKSRYASLDACIETWQAAEPQRDGLAFSQACETIGESWALTTRLMHTSGQWVESTVPLIFDKTKNPMQELGKATTYARRQGLAILGLVTEEDTDGEGQKRPAAQSATTMHPDEIQSRLLAGARKGVEGFRHAWKQLRPEERNAVPPELIEQCKQVANEHQPPEPEAPRIRVSSGDYITGQQKKMLEARIGKAGMDREEVKRKVAELTGAEHFSDILKADFQDVLEVLFPGEQQ